MFGNFLFFSNFVFIAFYLKALIFALIKKKQNYLEVNILIKDETENLDLEIEEKELLI